jgi:hypothetical protein
MGNAGQDSKLQVGAELTWGTGVAPTVAVDFTGESLKQNVIKNEEDALLGQVATGRLDTMGYKVDGDFSMIIKPDNIGLLLSAALGAEAPASAVNVGSTVYDHTFSCLAMTSSNSLPSLTIVVDRKAKVAGYISCKVNSMSLEAKVNDYLRATFSVIGRNEQSDALESLAISTKRPFLFRDGNITVDGSNYADVTGATVQVSNNLEDDIFTMDSSAYMQEIEPQKREITINLDALYSTNTNTTRENKFIAGATAALVLTFVSTESPDSGYYYTLTITCPVCYVTEAHPMVSGPERIQIPMTLKATQNASNQPITVTLRDGIGSKFIS